MVDLSAGVGGELKHCAQNNTSEKSAEPRILLGITGTLALGSAPQPWQVVGYQERCDIPDDAEEDTTFWREYLLYNRTQGFAFLVDSNDGCSWSKPIAGVPTVRGDAAQWQNANHEKRWAFAAKVTWVQVEFYWRVQRDDGAQVIAYEGQGKDGTRRLSREQTGNEVTWSAGQTLNAGDVADAFGIAAGSRAALQRDVLPLAAGTSGFSEGVVVFAVVVILIIVLAQCSHDDCDDARRTFGAASTEYQQCQRSSGSGNRGGSTGGGTGGGSYGGYSSDGGGHK